jgi:hypothetical protein
LFWLTFLEKPATKPAIDKTDLLSTQSVYAPATKALAEAKKIDQTPSETQMTNTIANMSVAQVRQEAVASSGMAITVEVQLQWSEYLNGEWSARESSGYGTAAKLIANGLPSFTSEAVQVHVSKEHSDEGDELGVYIHLGPPFEQAFYLASRNSSPQNEAYSSNGNLGKVPANPFSAGASRFWNNRHEGANRLMVRYRKQISSDPESNPVVHAVDTILDAAGSYKLLMCNNNLQFPAAKATDPAVQGAANPASVAAAINAGLEDLASLSTPFFFQDDRRHRTMFVQPNVVETTVENWKGWLSKPPELNSAPLDLHPLAPFVPKLIPKINRVLEVPPIDRHSIKNLTPRNDWLVNPVTGLAFNANVVGPQGWTGLKIGQSATTDLNKLVPDTDFDVGILQVSAGLATANAAQASGTISVVSQTGFSQAHEARLNALAERSILPGLAAGALFDR